LATKTATQIVFGAAGGAALAGVIGISVIVIGPALNETMAVVAYFGWLGALSILATGVLVPVCFKPRSYRATSTREAWCYPT
jgi:ABC-type phosphate transport system permease subunit